MTGWRIGFAVGNAQILAGLATIKTNLDSVGVMRRFCQNILYNTASSSSGALILFQHDINRNPRFDIFPVLDAHILATTPSGISGRSQPFSEQERSLSINLESTLQFQQLFYDLFRCSRSREFLYI